MTSAGLTEEDKDAFARLSIRGMLWNDDEDTVFLEPERKDVFLHFIRDLDAFDKEWAE